MHGMTLMMASLLAAPGGLTVDVGAHFSTLVHAATDTDFDPSARFYDPDGQWQGQAATFFAPRIDLKAGEVTLTYGLELGWAAWSHTDTGEPNAWSEPGRGGATLRHKLIHVDWRPEEDVLVRVGYQHFEDPTGLFLNHEAGAALVTLGRASRVTAWIGQMPDDTYEGVDVRDDNFANDSVLGAVQGRVALDGVGLDVGLYGVRDGRLDQRPLTLGTGLAGITVDGILGGDGMRDDVRLHALGQIGTRTGGMVDGGDAAVRAWAAALAYRVETAGWRARLGAFALSGDDEWAGNDVHGAFFGSGKNASPSKVLTEDEVRDRYDNLDDRVGTAWGPFVYQSAGLAVVDVAFTLHLDRFQPGLVVAAGLPLTAENAGGHGFTGVETSVLLDIALADQLWLHASGTVFVPGGAAAVFVNDVDRTATEPLYSGQLGLVVSL